MLSISLHPLLNPSPRLSSLPLSSLLILQNILNSMSRRHMPSPLDALPGRQPFLPLLQVRKLLNIHPSPPRRSHPPPMRNIRQRDMVTDQESALRGLQMRVQHPVQPARLVGVPRHAVLDALRRVPREVVRLALHGADAGVLEVQPADHLVVLAGVGREGDLVLCVVLLGEVGEDAAGFEEADLLPVGEGVC